MKNKKGWLTIVKQKIVLIFLLVFLVLTSTSFAAPKPVIKADKTYFDINSGLYVLKGNVYIEVKNRIITANLAKVSLGSLEVWGSGGVVVIQDDITFTGDSVYVYGTQDKAEIDGGITFNRTGLSISADKAEFNWRTKLGVFTGNVKITQDGNTRTADTVTYNVDTNTIL